MKKLIVVMLIVGTFCITAIGCFLHDAKEVTQESMALLTFLAVSMAPVDCLVDGGGSPDQCYYNAEFLWCSSSGTSHGIGWCSANGYVNNCFAGVCEQ